MLGLFKSKKKSTRAKILVVDDEPDLVNTVQCRLKWHRCEVITASNGKEGLEKAISERPDLILLDLNMPVMNGHEMLKRLRNHPDAKSNNAHRALRGTGYSCSLFLWHRRLCYQALRFHRVDGKNCKRLGN